MTVLLKYLIFHGKHVKLQMLSFFSKASPAPFMLECNLQPLVSQTLLT